MSKLEYITNPIYKPMTTVDPTFMDRHLVLGAEVSAIKSIMADEIVKESVARFNKVRADAITELTEIYKSDFDPEEFVDSLMEKTFTEVVHTLTFSETTAIDNNLGVPNTELLGKALETYYNQL